jgi:hypothetical protein
MRMAHWAQRGRRANQDYDGRSLDLDIAVRPLDEVGVVKNSLAIDSPLTI